MEILRRRVQQPVRRMSGVRRPDQRPEAGPVRGAGDQDDLGAAVRRAGSGRSRRPACAGRGRSGGRADGGRGGGRRGAWSAGRRRRRRRRARPGDVPARRSHRRSPPGGGHQQPLVRAQPQRGQVPGPGDGVRLHGKVQVQEQAHGPRRRALRVEADGQLGEEGDLRQPDGALRDAGDGGQPVRGRRAARGGAGSAVAAGSLGRGLGRGGRRSPGRAGRRRGRTAAPRRVRGRPSLPHRTLTRTPGRVRGWR